MIFSSVKDAQTTRKVILHILRKRRHTQFFTYAEDGHSPDIFQRDPTDLFCKLNVKTTSVGPTFERKHRDKDG